MGMRATARKYNGTAWHENIMETGKMEISKKDRK